MPRFRRFACANLAALCAFFVSAEQLRAVEGQLNSPIRVVAVSGQPVPGLPAGTVFSGFDVPVINDKGQVAFYAVATDSNAPGSTPRGIWSEGTGSLGV